MFLFSESDFAFFGTKMILLLALGTKVASFLEVTLLFWNQNDLVISSWNKRSFVYGSDFVFNL